MIPEISAVSDSFVAISSSLMMDDGMKLGPSSSAEKVFTSPALTIMAPLEEMNMTAPSIWVMDAGLEHTSRLMGCFTE